MSVGCMRDPRYGRTWPRDPALDVPCPTCGAKVGVRCRRPSGHGCEVHAERDIAADRAGAYGECPLALCGLANVARRRAEEQAAAASIEHLPLFAATTETEGRNP